MAEEQAALEITIKDRKTTVRLADLTGRDVKDFRGEVGFTPMHAFRNPDAMDIDVIAAFVWIERRKLKPTLTYDDILDGITYDNVKVSQTDGGDGGDEDDPEA